MGKDQRSDWQEVVDLNPRGYVELNNGKDKVIYGPVKSVTIDPETDWVVVTTKWQAAMPTNDFGIHTGNWQAIPQNDPISFPNFVVPYVIENTPDKGRRVRFGLSIIYLDPVEKVDPSMVEGLILPS